MFERYINNIFTAFKESADQANHALLVNTSNVIIDQVNMKLSFEFYGREFFLKGNTYGVNHQFANLRSYRIENHQQILIADIELTIRQNGIIEFTTEKTKIGGLAGYPIPEVFTEIEGTQVFAMRYLFQLEKLLSTF